MVTDVTRASGIETFKFEGSVDSEISIFGFSADATNRNPCSYSPGPNHCDFHRHIVARDCTCWSSVSSEPCASWSTYVNYLHLTLSNKTCVLTLLARAAAAVDLKVLVVRGNGIRVPS
jgi:hypothetical protein